jgi:hypothetical protein
MYSNYNSGGLKHVESHGCASNSFVQKIAMVRSVYRTQLRISLEQYLIVKYRVPNKIHEVYSSIP